MAANVAPPAGELVFVTPTTRFHISRQAKAGQAMRLATGVYAVGATLPPEGVARQHRWAIIAHYWPGAVLCGRTALAGGDPEDGFMFVAHPDPARQAELKLPGFAVRVQVGPGSLPGDMPMPNELWLSGPARGLVENVHLPGRPMRSRAGTTAVEDAIDEMARSGGAGRVRTTLTQLDVIAGSFDRTAVELVRERLAAVLGTFPAGGRTASPRLRARLAGRPYDQHRLSLLGNIIEALNERAPTPRHTDPAAARWTWLPFFEAYFSNFIEGTRFSIEEAREIVVNGVVPKARPKDAHDVAATYRLTADPVDSALIPRSPDELIDVLKRRHEVLMAVRPDKRPGEFKVEDNYAGGYRFVDPELVEGTLHHGFDMLNALVDPFGRSVAMMVLVTEVHPFDDGNGRIARLMSNSELTGAGQIRFVIPTIYRNNYLSGLGGVSNGTGRGESLIAVLDYAQRWTAALDWESYDAALAALKASNAFVEPSEAESSGLRLRMPP